MHAKRTKSILSPSSISLNTSAFLAIKSQYVGLVRPHAFTTFPKQLLYPTNFQNLFVRLASNSALYHLTLMIKQREL